MRKWLVERALRRMWMVMAVKFAIHEEKLRARQTVESEAGRTAGALYAEGMADYAAGVATLFRELATGEDPDEAPLPTGRPRLEVVR